MIRLGFRTASLFALVATALATAGLFPSVSIASAAASTPEPKTFVYILRLIPRLHDDRAWTDKDTSIIQRHAARLTAETNARRIILAGRTTEPGDQTFGLVIFEATDEASARAYMQADPAVAEGIMTATVHPYLIAFQREPLSTQP